MYAEQSYEKITALVNAQSVSKTGEKLNISQKKFESLIISDTGKDEVRGYCPQCGCNDAWFNRKIGLWHCWQCLAKGKIVGLADENYKKDDVPEVVLDVPRLRKIYTGLAEKYHQNITPEAVTYLKGRGLTEQTIEKFKLGFCSTDFYDEYSDEMAEVAGVMSQKVPSLVNRIVIPYIVGNEVVDLRGRILDSMTYRPHTPVYRGLAGARKARGASSLFNYNVIEPNQKLIITEGEFKSIVGGQFGFPIVATPGVSVWDDNWNALFKGKEVILVADYDASSGTKTPAYTMAKSLSARIPQLKVASLKWLCPKGKVDIDSLLIQGSPETFKRALDGAVDARLWLTFEERIGRGRRKAK